MNTNNAKGGARIQIAGYSRDVFKDHGRDEQNPSSLEEFRGPVVQARVLLMLFVLFYTSFFGPSFGRAAGLRTAAQQRRCSGRVM